MLAKLLLLFASVTLSTCRPKQSFHWDNIKYVYAFGDSYSRIPGTFGLPPFSFIGDATNLAFTPEQLLTDKIIANETSSGGSNWLEYLTSCFEGLPALCPKQLWDFAHGGATVDSSMLPPKRVTTVQLTGQVQQWLDYAADVLPRPAGETLTAWWMGINDCTHACDNETITDMNAFLDADLESYFNVVNTAARNGLRTHLFLNVPPIDRSPFAETILTGSQGLKDVIARFNEKFAVRIANYAKENPDQLVMAFDAAAVFMNILENPGIFGFNDTTTFCEACSDQGRFWHNDEHPTERVHQILAEAIEEYLRSPNL